jgi:hypothetical protein
VTLEDIQEILAFDALTFDDVKRLTRAGMGICQGRMCENVITDLLIARG